MINIKEELKHCMMDDGEYKEPAIFLVVDKDGNIVVYAGVNVPEVRLVREDEDKVLFDTMKEVGAVCLADPTVNFVTGLKTNNG